MPTLAASGALACLVLSSVVSATVVGAFASIEAKEVCLEMLSVARLPYQLIVSYLYMNELSGNCLNSLPQCHVCQGH